MFLCSFFWVPTLWPPVIHWTLQIWMLLALLPPTSPSDPPSSHSVPNHQQHSVILSISSLQSSEATHQPIHLPPPSFRGPWPGAEGGGPLKALMKYRRVLNWLTLIKKETYGAMSDCWEMMTSHRWASLFHTCWDHFRWSASYYFQWNSFCYDCMLIKINAENSVPSVFNT